ncbi:SURF1 family protein [Hyphococcus sp.]|uniref:SURF1 family protein n=1 Tax=Hyphococcus sp. TaxID=2038636 RepID=UPI002084B9A1|nr:MAG: SURF1-like protein [Marinicaulis sp.]
MTKSLHFTFRPILAGLCFLMAGFLCSLGVWQLHRLEWKNELIAQVNARMSAPAISFDEAVRRAEEGEWMEYSPVLLAGHADEKDAAVVFGSYEAAAGGYYFVPVLRSVGESAYVNEGFVPQKVLKEKFPSKRLNGATEETVSGLFRYRETPTPPASWFQTKGKSADGLWFIRDPLAFAGEVGVNASPYYVDQFVVEGRDWPLGGTTRVEFSNRHLEYALTWFGLALSLVGVWIAFSLQKRG